MHEIKELTKDEIELRLTDSLEELYNLRFYFFSQLMLILLIYQFFI